MCVSALILFAREINYKTRFCYDADMSASGLTSGNEMHNYIAREDDRAGHRMLKDTKTLGSAYDRYLQSGGVTSEPVLFT